MSSYNKLISIEKMDIESEKWVKFYSTHANVNKTGGREYTNASTNISSSSYDFKVRYCSLLEDIIYNTEIYRILYCNRYFNRIISSISS